MRFENVALAGMGYHMPPNTVTSAQIERRLKPLYDRLSLPEGRLELMTGIRERRFWDPGTTPSEVAIKAGENAIANSGVPKEKIKALFHASVCRDFLEPATASLDHLGLGLPDDSMIFDISNACLGVLNGIVTLANMIELGQVEAGVIVAGEMGETLVDSTIGTLNKNHESTRQNIKPAFASLTIGSGAAAVVLAKKGLAPVSHRLVGGVAMCATEEAHLCKSNVDEGFSNGFKPLMQTDSEQLLKAGCKLAAKAWKAFLDEIGWGAGDLFRTFTHQVGASHRKLLYQSLGLDMSADFSTVEFLGNVGSVSLPITLALGAEKGIINPKDKVALLGIGSGLNCLMLGLEW